jgi:DNA polymerase-4
MDAFFASVEVLDNPDLCGKAVIVGGGVRGVVSAASYEARRFGVHSALPMVTAHHRCPSGIFLPPRMARYQEISAAIMAIFKQYTPLVEPLSLDEAFLDVTGSERLFGPAATLAAHIRAEVRTLIGLTVSAGVATSKLVAKIASDIHKPDGLTIVAPGREVDFLTPLAITKLPGVGPATMKHLTLLGVRTIGDLARVPTEILVAKLGQSAGLLQAAAQGLDDRPVEAAREAKSIGHEETFGKDLVEMDVIRKELLALAIKVGRRLRQHGMVARTVVVKTRYHDFQQTTRSTTLATASADDEVLYQAGCRLLKETHAGRKPLRLLGITATNLLVAGQARPGSLFTEETDYEEKRRRINLAVDRITATFGREAIKPGTLVEG